MTRLFQPLKVVRRQLVKPSEVIENHASCELEGAMSPTNRPDWKPNFIIVGKRRFEQGVLNLPHILAVEGFAAEQAYEMPKGNALP